MKKKQQKKAFKEIKKANSDCFQLLNVIMDNHDLTDEEVKGMNAVCDHLLNMNVLFSKIEEGNKTNDKVL